MSKSRPKPPSYADMIDLPEDTGAAPAQAVAVPAAPVADPVPAVVPGQEKVAEPVKVSIPAPTPVSGPVTPALKDGTPTAWRRETKAKAEPSKPAASRKVSGVPSRREAARLRRLEPKPEPADYAQRSLYAREETFQRFRTLAFENGKAAQELYREGLFLVLQKYGQADGLTVDDM